LVVRDWIIGLEKMNAKGNPHPHTFLCRPTHFFERLKASELRGCLKLAVFVRKIPLFFTSSIIIFWACAAKHMKNRIILKFESGFLAAKLK
jgi:hypothetical protein